jgi:hypothetical protein
MSVNNEPKQGIKDFWGSQRWRVCKVELLILYRAVVMWIAG